MLSGLRNRAVDDDSRLECVRPAPSFCEVCGQYDKWHYKSIENINKKRRHRLLTIHIKGRMSETTETHSRSTVCWIQMQQRSNIAPQRWSSPSMNDFSVSRIRFHNHTDHCQSDPEFL